MYGTTEELFFVNWDLGGNYWDQTNKSAMKSYNQFDPSNLVAKWDTPCLLYTSDAADERSSVDLGGRRIIKKKKKYNTWCINISHNKKKKK